MDDKAKRELAEAFKETYRIREASYRIKDGNEFGAYTKHFSDAAKEACKDPDLVDIISLMGMYSGDALEWADRILNPTQAVA